MKLIILFLSISCVLDGDTTRDTESSEAWNELFDQAIEEARNAIIANHFDIVHVPDIQEELKTTILGIPWSFILKIHGAEFSNASSVSRKGPLSILEDDVTGNITFSTTLGFNKLALNCPQLYLKANSLSFSRSIYIASASNAVEFSISLLTDRQDKCRAHFNWARITKFKDVAVKIQPSGLFNWITEHLASFIMNNFSNFILGLVSSNINLADKVNVVTNNIDFCNLLQS
uniref:Putative secreted protein rhodnius neglectus n=1 Tax=Rhodnius prolixus TaxID=13249 RepID=A0A4P6DGE5_RHOPR